MSILIKGMKMPKEGEQFIVTVENGTWIFQKCCELGKRFTVLDVPSHGDLIDAQELQMYLMQSCDYDTYDDYSRTFDMLDNASTVIEAEEEE